MGSAASTASASPRAQAGAGPLRCRGRAAGLRPSPWVWAGVLTLLVWPVRTLVPGAGLDASWQVGLVMAARQGVHHGSGLLFTYGPLGQLSIEPALWTRQTGVLTVLATLVSHLLLARALIAHTRAAMPLLPALVVTAAVLAVSVGMTQVDVATAACFLAAVLVVRAPAPPRTAVLLGMAAAADTLLLVKVSNGVLVVGLTLVLAVRWGVRSTVTAVTGLLLLLPVLWVLAGQHLGDLLTWCTGSLQLAGGYAAAMAIEVPDQTAGYRLLGPTLLAVAAATWAQRRGRRWVFLLVAVYLALSLKEGWVRHDAGHARIWYVALVVVAVSLLDLAPRRPRHLGVGVLVAAAALYAFSVDVPRTRLHQLATGPVRAVQQVADLTVASRAHAITSRAQVRLQAAFPLGREVLDQVGDRPVQVDLWETDVVWANGLRWRPTPVFQPYAAYTADLDARNAAALARGDRVVLRLPGTASIDGRLAAWETPASLLALQCHFQAAPGSGPWLVHVPRPAARCSAPVRRSQVRVRAGQAVPVPVYEGQETGVTVDVRTSLVERARALLLKPSSPVLLRAGTGPFNRLVLATAQGAPLLLRVPPTSLAAPLLIDPQPSDVTVGGTGDDEVTLTFWSIG